MEPSPPPGHRRHLVKVVLLLSAEEKVLPLEAAEGAEAPISLHVFTIAGWTAYRAVRGLSGGGGGQTEKGKRNGWGVWSCYQRRKHGGKHSSQLRHRLFNCLCVTFSRASCLPLPHSVLTNSLIQSWWAHIFHTSFHVPPKSYSFSVLCSSIRCGCNVNHHKHPTVAAYPWTQTSFKTKLRKVKLGKTSPIRPNGYDVLARCCFKRNACNGTSLKCHRNTFSILTLAEVMYEVTWPVYWPVKMCIMFVQRKR